MKSDINILFNPDYYLVSPLVNVQYFLKKRYFLTENQAELKHNIIDCLKNNKMVSIVGDEKSGRTLLLFDLAMDLAKKNNIFFFLSDKEFDKQKRKYQLYPFKLFFKDSLFAAISSNDKKIDYIIIDNLDFLSNYEIETLYYFCLKNNSKVLVTMGSSVTNNNKSGIIKDIFNAMSINFYLKSN
jgi:predicted AAA+ superfamily ATPase